MRFISKKEPELSYGVFKIGNVSLKYDPVKPKAGITTEVYTVHNGIDKITVYMTDLVALNADERIFEVEV